MRAGRYRQGAVIELFSLSHAGKVVNWRVLAEKTPDAELRAGLQRAVAAQDAASDSQAAQAAFCAALPLLERRFAAAASTALESPLAAALPATLEPPVTPRTFLCVGLNYRDHARESGAELPAHPLLFAKTGNAVSGHGHPVRLPATTPELAAQVDYEAELAVVIGRPCRSVAPERALEHVAGYLCANDVSARAFQFGDGQWYRGKSCDTFGPLGPWLVTPSEVGDPHELRIRLRLNGQTMQDSSTSQLIFRVPELIAFISNCITLQPGDIISTGTPPGVGFARKPPVFLKPGDQMEVEIDRLGVLANAVEAVQIG